MKKLFIIILFLFSFFNLVFANDQQKSSLLTWNTVLTWIQQNCNLYKGKFSIIWHDDIKVWHNSTFNIKNIHNISWDIYRNKKKVFSNKWNFFSYSFKSPWKVKLQAIFKYKNCDIKITKNLNIYDEFIVSLMKEKDISFISSLWNKKQHIYYKNYSLEDIFKNKYILDTADYIIIDKDYIIPFLLKLWSWKNVNNAQKFVFLVSSSKWFFSRLIIPYIKWLNKNNIYIYKKERFLEIITNIYQWQDLDKKNLLSLSNVWNKIYLPLSYFLNKLIEHHLNIEIFWIALLALFWTLLVAFFRQVIWFSVFWVYTPLIFSLLIITLWYKITLLLFLISVLSSMLTYFITKKIYILYSSKISLNYIIYVILSIILIWMLLNYVNFNFSEVNSSVILSFFVMPLLTKNLIKEDTKIFSKTFLLFVSEFIFIVAIFLTIFKINLLKYILIAYPDILWLFVVVVMFIGRFTWLQLLEYIRFYPLIKKNLSEEEEE